VPAERWAPTPASRKSYGNLEQYRANECSARAKVDPDWDRFDTWLATSAVLWTGATRTPPVSALKRAQPPSARAEPHDLAVSGVNDLASSSAAGQRHARHGRIRKWDATDAAVHDSQKLDDVLDDKDARWSHFPRAVTESDSWELARRIFRGAPYDQGYDLDCD
jgi:hypothetical protein